MSRCDLPEWLLRAPSRILLLAALALFLLPAASASAGRLLVTGHDADLHCGGQGPQCHFVKVAVDFVRGGAPNPSAPVLVLDRAGLSLDASLDSQFFGGPPGAPRVVMDPRSAAFQGEPLTTDRYSAVLIASDTTCGGCDLNEFFDPQFPGADTPDSDAINSRKADFEAFFNAGGGIYANSGADHADGNPDNGADVYYNFLPLPASGVAVSEPFCLTDAGKALGFEDTQCPDASRHNGDGTNQDINCCATHNSFQLPPADSELKVAEVDGGGFAETLFAEGVITGGTIQRPGTTPPPGDTTPPDTPIASGPPAFGEDNTPTFTFSSTEPGSRFECSLDGGPFVPCSSPFTTPRLAGGRHTLTVRAIDAAGNVDPTPAIYIFEIAMELRDLPDPQVGVTVNVQEVSGTVLVGIPAGAARSARAGGSGRASQKGISFVPLSQARQVPVGSFLDTRKGTVRLQSASNRAGDRQTGDFLSSIFQIKQSRKRSAKGLTDLVLKGASFNRCQSGGRGKGASAAQVSRRTIRRLRGNAKGRFRTRGRYSSATVRGTRWETRDRCDGTLTKVARGRVVVRDFRRKRNILLTAGKSYLAKAPG